MTLTRTIRRREQRKRAKRRPKPTPSRLFTVPDWVGREQVDRLCEQIKIWERISREY